MRGGRFITNVSVATRLALLALLVTLISLVITAAVGLRRGNELADDIVEDRLVSVAASRVSAVEAYVQSTRREIATLALSPVTAANIVELGDAVAELDGEEPSQTQATELTEYYLNEIGPALQEVRGSVVGLTTLYPTGSAAVHLQHAYAIPRPIGGDDGERDGERGDAVEPEPLDPRFVIDAGDGSEYSELHTELHPQYGEIAAGSGFDDLFLIDARADTIVYSARKRTDFATSLELGPLSGSSLASLVEEVAVDPEPGTTVVADLSAYPAAIDRPTGFVASPVVADGELVGYVAAALADDELDAIMSSDGSYEGLEDTGETYVAGADGTMRTVARPFAESPTAFFATGSDDGRVESLSDQDRRRVVATGTTALVQPVNRRVLEAAQQGSGTVEALNYRGEAVLTSYRPIGVEDLGWVVFAEISADEVDDPVEDYARDMLFAVALFVVAVTFIAVRWSNRIIEPVRVISARLRAVRSGATAADATGSMPASSPEEYVELSENIDDMLVRLEQRRADVSARAAERAQLVHAFLPASVARRREEGDADVLDHVPNASVTVLVFDGLGGVVERGSEDEVRGMLGHLVDELDALAAEHGLERVKVTGDAYYAVCGVSRPYLDHAPRSVAFALAVHELVGELAEEHGVDVAVRAGIDDGPVSVGLTGRSGLVYDSWGDAVSGADELARRSPPDAVTVSAAVRRQLPDDFVVAAGDAGDDAPVVVTGRTTTGAAT